MHTSSDIILSPQQQTEIDAITFTKNVLLFENLSIIFLLRLCCSLENFALLDLYKKQNWPSFKPPQNKMMNSNGIETRDSLWNKFFLLMKYIDDPFKPQGRYRRQAENDPQCFETFLCSC